ncbi:hypothetical protein CTAM01_17292 [Colletotrichum tamarilloi]|uniref:Uncharacterized protein n=1 Tax=Colletotrichum tamarilloi TaxID=1209934 RepID=A0ABQ9QG64_9PEZI|nr:uncharacterized protein CTAM01_17292 [Colletotrichum tamarilloi]KAK1452373.1 hypothetical protein CTAM01_17292 [Colletotrichum tamarilloi]
MSRLEAQCVEHITIYHKRITKSRGIRNDEDTTTGPRLRQRRDLPIFKTSPESSSSARTAPTSPTTAARQKAILTTTAQKAQSETKTTPNSTDWKAYASTLRYWSCSAQDDGGSIKHEEISFCPEFQGLSQDDIRKKLLEKIHRAARRNVRDES